MESLPGKCTRPLLESPRDGERVRLESSAAPAATPRFGYRGHLAARPSGKGNLADSQDNICPESATVRSMEEEDDIKARVMTAAASGAILDKMRERGWVDSKGRVEWSKLQAALREKRRVNASRQKIQQQVLNIGGKSVLVRDMLKVLDLPLSLLHDLDDGERLILLAVHEEGLGQLSPEQQIEVEKEVRRSIRLRVLEKASPKR